MTRALLVLLLLAGCGPAQQPPMTASDRLREDPTPFVQHGLDLIQRQQCERAMAEGFEPALAIFERQRDTAEPPRASRMINAAQVSSLDEDPEAAAAPDAQIGPEWSDTMYLQAFCLVEVGQIDQAEQLLQRALTLIPDDVVYACELGHIRQGQGRHEDAMALYRGALENVRGLRQSGSMGGTRLFGNPLDWWERRALRGIGYSQIEIGQLEAADATYRAVLAIDPSDERALRELELISVRRGAI